MATKTPGIYFQEIDNTQYTNPKSVTGTTVCIVGFATKGPIGVPTMITSLSSFKSIFGEGVKGYYSALAVKNILSAGGKILFVRVADASASNSIYVIKNGVEQTKGKAIFDRGTDILKDTKDYENKAVYGIKIEGESGASKEVFVRSPSSGKMTQASIFEQINEQAKVKTSPVYEALHRGFVRSGVYSFNIKKDDVIMEDGKQYFIETQDDESTTIFKTSIENALNNGTNKLYSLVLTKEMTGTTGSETYFDPSASLTEIAAKNYGFSITTGDTTSNIVLDDISKKSLVEIAAIIDKKISEFNVRCVLYEGKSDEKPEAPRLVFVNSIGNSKELKVASLAGETAEITDLFLTKSSAGESMGIKTDPAEEKPTNGFLVQMTNSVDQGAPNKDVVVKLNEDTDSISFELNKGLGKGKKLEIIKAKYGEFIFSTDSAKRTLNSMSCNFIKNDKEDIINYEGQDELSGIIIKRNSNTRKIYFENELGTAAPTLSDLASGKGRVLSLLNIEKDPNSETSTGYTKEKGKDFVDDKERDMVAIISKEKGSSTNNISVEFHLTKSPIDGSEKKDIYIYVDGELRETYEDVYDKYGDPDKESFIEVINKLEDEGGSKYISMELKKNNTMDKTIEVKPGTYYVGKSNFPGDKKKTDNIKEDDYNAYEYAVGEDGISEDSGLFMKAMDIESSPISDEQLYNFHIIIFPDCHLSEEVQDAAIALCESRKDSFTIIDPPVGLNKDAVIDWHNGKGEYGRTSPLDTNYAATYWPWCKVYDSVTKQYTWVMPSVIMAAQYVRVDKNAGSWYAPAGEANGILPITDIQTYPNKNERADLYLEFNRINPIIKVEGDTFLAFGEKTLQRRNSVLTKIHARRMMIEIKKQIRSVLRPYIFMPNTSEYLPKINSKITAILEKFKVGGGLDSYRVVCDETNNTSATRQQDIINVSVAVVPNGTIEEINITFNINKTDKEITTD